MGLNLASILFESARQHPNQLAIVGELENWSYETLALRVSQCARALRDQGILPGDRVALMAPNMPQFTVAYFGIMSAGAIVVPIHILLTGKEVGFCLKHSGARAFIFWEDVALAAKEGMVGSDVQFFFQIDQKHSQACREFDQVIQSTLSGDDPFPTGADDTAVVFYTSGTTGSPKGAEVTHFNLYSNAQWVSERSLTTVGGALEFWGPGHVSMAVLPLSHSFAQTTMQNAPLVNGGAISYLLRFDALDLVKKLKQCRVSVMAIVPRIVKEMLLVKEAQNLEAFRFCLVGGAPIDLGDIEAFESKFGVSVLEGYGLSETSPVIVFRTPAVPRCRGSVGRAIRGVEIGVVDEQGERIEPGQKGEIVVKGHAVMKGYYQNLKATQEAIKDGWFYTGDIGFVDGEQRVFIVDRKKDIIIRSGFTIYPIEVEEVLRQHPKVQDVAVVGVPHEKHGEEIKAVVVGHLTEEEIQAHCQSQLASFKCPRIIEFREELPKGIKGQILRRMLK